MIERKNWLAVVSAEHAARGRIGGFIQVCHGKKGPLSRMHAGDRVTVYAPTVSFGGKDRCQSFVSLGMIRDEDVFDFDMGGGFVPFRRRVDYAPDAIAAPISPLLDRLDLTRGKTNWGYPFRFGLLEISPGDMAVIAEAMGVLLAA